MQVGAGLLQFRSRYKGLAARKVRWLIWVGRMKSFRVCLLASVSSAALIGGAAAADMPTKVPPPVPPPVMSWTGPYIGINLGAAWNNAKFSDLGVPGTNPPLLYGTDRGANDPFWSPNEAGFAGGGQVGYNYQTGNFVFGVEGDFSGIANKASVIFTPPLSGLPISATSDLEWMATVRGRLGLAFGQVLVYGTGGVAFARFSDAWGRTFAGGRDFAKDETRSGWVAGGGLEYMLSRNWTVRVEGLYADFGSDTFSVVNPPGNSSGTYSTKFQHTVTTARAGLNWKW